jgi:hypothetical protein
MCLPMRFSTHSLLVLYHLPIQKKGIQVPQWSPWRVISYVRSRDLPSWVALQIKSRT